MGLCMEKIGIIKSIMHIFILIWYDRVAGLTSFPRQGRLGF